MHKDLTAPAPAKSGRTIDGELWGIVYYALDIAGICDMEQVIRANQE